MLLWAGLGNPEPGMQANRHNIGFMIVDQIAQYYGFTSWRKRFSGEVCEGKINNQKILLLKPMTYMNLSGNSVHPAISFYKIPLSNLFIFHDELDLSPGRVKVKQGGGAAGHNGLRSIDQSLGNQAYWRIRLGIGHPVHRSQVVHYVLGNFSSTDQQWLTPFIKSVVEACPFLIENKMDGFMTKVALLMKE